ncbi:hypothetical protein BMS3Bbin02_02074 [bacterium BMS3Bbin02]|nr:hypothetical protein BMS3Bbin02_02074 [bacterium BMS3Bbin02]
MQDLPHLVLAEERRVEFHYHIESALVQQVLGDPFDFVGGAAVERRKGDGVGDCVVERQVTVLREWFGDQRAQRIDVAPGVL